MAASIHHSAALRALIEGAPGDERYGCSLLYLPQYS
jgi:hypothetical protein